MRLRILSSGAQTLVLPEKFRYFLQYRVMKEVVLFVSSLPPCRFLKQGESFGVVSRLRGAHSAGVENPYKVIVSKGSVDIVCVIAILYQSSK